MTKQQPPHPAASSGQPEFKYKPNYVAAWLSPKCEDALGQHGIRRRVHLTTFFDGYGQLSSVVPYRWTGTKTARIAAVVEWVVGDTRHLIAELAECAWSADINQYYRDQGVREDFPHKAHLTLDKRVPEGTAAMYQALVGMELTFDRHGGQEDDRPPFTVTGDIMLRDWKFQWVTQGQIKIVTPPMRSGVRETYFADATRDSGYFLLAKALMTARRSIGPDQAELFVNSVALKLLGHEVDPAPGVDWHCARDWSIKKVREQVRLALADAGIPGFLPEQ